MVSDLYDLISNSSTQVLVFLSVLSRGFSRDAHAQFEHGSSATCRMMIPEEQEKLRQDLLR